MSTFRIFQLQLENMAVAGEKFLRTSKKLHNTIIALIQVLSEKRYEYYGLGEDILTKSPEVVTASDRLSVPALSATPGVVTFRVNQYAYAVLHTKVLLEGTGLSWEIKKTYANPAGPPVLFNNSQLPLLSDNNQLIVTIQPGGEFFGAALLQEITML